MDWIELDVVVHDDTPDELIQLTPMLAPGLFGGITYFVSNGAKLRVARLVAPPILNLVCLKSNTQKVYISLNVDLLNDVVLDVYAVDESGSSGGGSEGDYRVAGTVKINSTAVQRDLVVISDNPSGREIVAEGESAGDGTFDITYSDWDGPVFVIALDQYGAAFAASAPLNTGTVVHPTTPNGYVYVVTESGTTGAAEPVWSTTGSVVSGSVTFAPREYYRPVGWGPQKGALVE